MPNRIFLSKSKIAAFEQCPKRLWLETHRRDLAQVAREMRANFEVGHQVGALACAAYPDGVMISPDGDLAEALISTARHLRSEARRPLFEATLVFEDVMVRIDLLIPDGEGWHLAEVKSTGGVKAYQLGDIATQLWVAQGSGLAISRASIRHIDTGFTYETEGDYGGLLVDAVVDALVAERVAGRAGVVEAAKAAAAGDEPIIEVGAHCADPFDCPFTGYCRRDLPPEREYPVSLLPGKAGKAAARQLLALGFSDLRDVPLAQPETELFRRIHEATITGMAHHDAAAFAAAVQPWSWPRYYLDFETISFAVPRWLGTRPYQAIPFQFSCHVENETGAIEHLGFLDLGGDDPSEACAQALIEGLGRRGPIITYNAAFERSCIVSLACRWPHLEALLRELASRIVDLLPLVRAHYYHPTMRGSWSIKAVLPARLPELSYSQLDGVQDGQAAQAAYLEAVAATTPTQRKDEIRRQLQAYCALDTWAMVQLARSLSVEGSAVSV